MYKESYTALWMHYRHDLHKCHWRVTPGLVLGLHGRTDCGHRELQCTGLCGHQSRSSRDLNMENKLLQSQVVIRFGSSQQPRRTGLCFSSREGVFVWCDLHSVWMRDGFLPTWFVFDIMLARFQQEKCSLCIKNGWMRSFLIIQTEKLWTTITLLPFFPLVSYMCAF